MPKFFKVSFALCFFFSIFLFYSGIVLAKTETYTLQEEDVNKMKPVITVEIGGFSGWQNTGGWSKGTEYCPGGAKAGTECLQVNWISDYIVAIYKYGIGLAAVLAVVVIMVGGFIWLVSGGSSTRVSTAKDFIVSALAGLMLALFSFVILYAVNPRLVSLGPITSTLSPVTADSFDNVPQNSFALPQLADLQNACQNEYGASCSVNVLDYRSLTDYVSGYQQTLEDNGIDTRFNPVANGYLTGVVNTLFGVNDTVAMVTLQPSEQLNEYISENGTYLGEDVNHHDMWRINDMVYAYMDTIAIEDGFMNTGNAAMNSSQNPDDFVPYWLVAVGNR